MLRPMHYLAWLTGLLVLGMSLNGCASVSDPPPLDVTTLKNLTYAGIYAEPVTLQQGYYEGQPYTSQGAARPRVQFAEQLYLLADLDNDGWNEAAGFISESAGGSGSYTYLVIIDQVAGQYRNVATQKLGDRVMVRALHFVAGTLELDMVVAGPREPACCPGLKVRKSYRYQAGQLQETATEERGQLGIQDLQGSWTLTHLSRQEAVPAAVKVDIEFRNDQFGGLAGCNRYFGSIKGKAPRDVVLGPIGATRMMCPDPQMQVEDRYLAALQQVTQFSFLFGQLVLGYQDNGAWHTLVFAPK